MKVRAQTWSVRKQIKSVILFCGSENFELLIGNLGYLFIDIFHLQVEVKLQFIDMCQTKFRSFQIVALSKPIKIEYEFWIT